MGNRVLGNLEVSAIDVGCMGKAFKGIRDKVVIASKCGVDFDYTVDPEVPSLLYDSSREGIRKSVEGSLKRLNTDYIDLYFQARIDPQVEPEEVAETMKELRQEGYIPKGCAVCAG